MKRRVFKVKKPLGKGIYLLGIIIDASGYLISFLFAKAATLLP